MGVKQTGTVAKWLNHRGIGFITPEGQEGTEGNDVLVHFKSIKQESEDGFRSLREGSKVEYSLEEDPKDAEKQVAVDVTGPDGADCEPRVKGERSKGKGKRSRKGKGKGKKGAKTEEEGAEAEAEA